MNTADSVSFQKNFLLENKYKIGLVFLLTSILFCPVIIGLVHVWSNREDYSHGFFVLPIVAFIVWARRSTLTSVSVRPTWLGLPLFFVGVLVYVASFLVKFHTGTYLSMILILLGLFIFVGGWALMKVLLLPTLFLLFMFPIPTAYYILITNPLKLMITKISTQIIYLLGIPVYREGNLIFLASSSFEVAEACSGIRSLYSYLMLGCLFAFLSEKNMSKVVLIVSTLPLAIFVNIVRVTGTGILSNYFGPGVARGFFHEFTGFVLFIFGFAILFLEYHLLESAKPG
jgi:exosortase